jgi:hypothetical protein
MTQPCFIGINLVANEMPGSWYMEESFGKLIINRGFFHSLLFFWSK